MTTTPKPRKPRKKQWASEVARQAHSNTRRRLAREAAERESNRLARARDEINSAARRARDKEANRRMNMVSNGLTPRLRAVMNSWGINLPLSISAAHTIGAHTDFKSITVYHDYRLVPRQDNFFNTPADDITETIVSEEELRQIAAETRGLFYHEVGHNLFTVPFQVLLTAAWKEGFVAPPSILHAVGTEDDGTTPTTWGGTRYGQMQQAWNVLEDQRMEAALVEDSPHIASYLTVLVMRNIVSHSSGNGAGSWALAAGRYYLPEAVRSSARTLWDSTVWSASDVEDTIAAYMVATTASDMVKQVLRMHDILGDMSIRQADSHGQFARADKTSTENAQEKISQVGQQAQQSVPSKEQEQGQSSASESSSDSDSDDGQADGNSNDSDSNSTSNSSQASTGAGSGDDFDSDSDNYWNRRNAMSDLREALQDAVSDLKDDETLTDDVRSMNEAHATDSGAMPQWGNVSSSTNEETSSKAVAVVDDIERAFMLATEDCAPHWESGQRRGVLDVIRYSTRQPGDVEIFRNYTDDGDPGHDLAVSLFLDISGSMMGTGDELGAAAWAVKVACDRLGISCDVSLFNESGYRLWEENDSPEYIPTIGAGGGTDPTTAFNSVLYEEREQKTHLVLIMTDGAWNNDNIKVTNWKHSNVHSVLFFYDKYSRSKAMQPDHKLAALRGADEAYEVNDLIHIPQALESILISLV